MKYQSYEWLRHAYRLAQLNVDGDIPALFLDAAVKANFSPEGMIAAFLGGILPLPSEMVAESQIGKEVS